MSGTGGMKGQRRTMQGRAVVAGRAAGEAVVSARPISLWGGLDAKTGEVIDRRHDCSGRTVTGRVFVYPWGKGSSTASAVLLESVRLGTAPAAIINCATDPMAALGSIIADELYGRCVPIVVLGEEDFRSVGDGDRLSITPDGVVTVENL
jgi:predicted aconitase with swiveling domain